MNAFAAEVQLIAGMLAVTFGVRYATLAVIGRMRMPPLVQRALQYVPVAVLTAIVVPAALMPRGTLWLGLDNAHLWAALAAAAVAWRWRSLVLTIAAGMAVFFAWRALFF